MATKIEIINNALEFMGKPSVQSLENPTDETVISLLNSYDLITDFIFDSFDWYFASELVILEGTYRADEPAPSGVRQDQYGRGISSLVNRDGSITYYSAYDPSYRIYKRPRNIQRIARIFYKDRGEYQDVRYREDRDAIHGEDFGADGLIARVIIRPSEDKYTAAFALTIATELALKASTKSNLENISTVKQLSEYYMEQAKQNDIKLYGGRLNFYGVEEYTQAYSSGGFGYGRNYRQDWS